MVLLNWELKSFKAIFYSSSQLIIFVKTVAIAPMNRKLPEKSLNQLKTSHKLLVMATHETTNQLPQSRAQND